jgi:predicted RNA binding protein YcfA (HicA-like mRNA interferase family)
MPLDRKDIEASLQKKGFEQREGDHSFYRYYTKAGKKTSVYTKTSHGTGHKTISDNLVSQMARQCGLTTAQFKDLVNCPLSRDKLEELVLQSGRAKP